jgi:5-methylthioadenosine/S-adenosylhomocysteine deaminase
MVTTEAARALAMEDSIGSLEVGKRADVIIVDLDSPHMWPVLTGSIRNVAEHLVYSANAADVITTVVDGQVLMEDRSVLTLDESEARTRAEDAALELIDRAGVGEYLQQRARDRERTA